MRHSRPRTPTAATAAGFSLVELLLALFTLSIVVLGIAAMELTVESELDESTIRTAATLAAQERLEQLIASDYDALVSGKEQWALFPKRNAVATWEVTADTPLPGMKTVDLTVSYVVGGERNVNLTTVVRR